MKHGKVNQESVVIQWACLIIILGRDRVNIRKISVPTWHVDIVRKTGGPRNLTICSRAFSAKILHLFFLLSPSSADVQPWQWLLVSKVALDPSTMPVQHFKHTKRLAVTVVWCRECVLIIHRDNPYMCWQHAQALHEPWTTNKQALVKAKSFPEKRKDVAPRCKICT